jgi:hypothetical protein
MHTMRTEDQPRPALPLLALLALASALGIAVAIALAAVAMLLAAPAYAADGDTDEGSLLLERPAGLAPARLLFTQSDSQEPGHKRVVEAYYNPFDEPLAGVYLYRLPSPGALLERLSFSLDGAEPHHAVLTRRRAGTLVERTGEIAPGETLIIELEYRTRSPRSVLARGAAGGSN